MIVRTLKKSVYTPGRTGASRPKAHHRFPQLLRPMHSMVPAPFGGDRMVDLQKAIDLVLSGRIDVTQEMLEQAGERLSQMITIAPQDLLNSFLPSAIANLADHGQALFASVMDHFFSTREGMAEKFAAVGELQKDLFRLLAINEVSGDPSAQERILEQIKPKELPLGAPEETYLHAFSALLKFFSDQVRGEFLGKPKTNVDWLTLGKNRGDVGSQKLTLEAEHLLKRFHESKVYRDVRREATFKITGGLSTVLSFFAFYTCFFGQGFGHLISVEFFTTVGMIASIFAGWGVLQALRLRASTAPEFRKNPFQHLPSHLAPAVSERIVLLTQTIEDVSQHLKTIRKWKMRLEAHVPRQLVGNRMLSIVRKPEEVAVLVSTKKSEFLEDDRVTHTFRFSPPAFEKLLGEHQAMINLCERLLTQLKSHLNGLMVEAKESHHSTNLEALIAEEIDGETLRDISDFLFIKRPLRIINNNSPSKADYARFLERVALNADVSPRKRR